MPGGRSTPHSRRSGAFSLAPWHSARADMHRLAPGTVGRVDLRPSRPGPICAQTGGQGQSGRAAAPSAESQGRVHVQAAVGDKIVVRGHHTGQAVREAVILAVSRVRTEPLPTGCGGAMTDTKDSSSRDPMPSSSTTQPRGHDRHDLRMGNPISGLRSLTADRWDSCEQFLYLIKKRGRRAGPTLPPAGRHVGARTRIPCLPASCSVQRGVAAPPTAFRPARTQPNRSWGVRKRSGLVMSFLRAIRLQALSSPTLCPARVPRCSEYLASQLRRLQSLDGDSYMVT
jgi:Domain of unknown function (DUF1918)